jgi:hypothetical protein
MPRAEAVVANLARISRDLAAAAFVWHVAAALVLVAWARGWRPSAIARVRARLALLLSVSGAAWLSGNLFNGAVFLGLAATASAARQGRIRDASPTSLAGLVGLAMLVLGWAYPHFTLWPSTLWTAPLGLIPCPTLSLLVGLNLLMGDRGRALAAAGLFYGILGVVWLGVGWDVVLALGSLFALVKSRDAEANFRVPRVTSTTRAHGMPLASPRSELF